MIPAAAMTTICELLGSHAVNRFVFFIYIKKIKDLLLLIFQHTCSYLQEPAVTTESPSILTGKAQRVLGNTGACCYPRPCWLVTMIFCLLEQKECARGRKRCKLWLSKRPSMQLYTWFHRFPFNACLVTGDHYNYSITSFFNLLLPFL